MFRLSDIIWAAMTTPFQSMLSAGDYNNQQLFSDHYLGTILRNRQDWQALAAQAEPTMSAIADILAKYQPSNIEAQVEDQLIKPVLLALGHTYEVQPSLDTPENTKRPDYVFYRDTAALNANKGATLTDDLPKQGAFAVGDAKYWDCPLDKVERQRGAGKSTFAALSVNSTGAGAGKAKERNPSAQIAFYILHTGLDWGILTNGRKWRIYHKSNSYKLDRFYEVDLPELVQSGDPLRFLYFYAFFQRAAFDAHPLGLASILEQSAEYARGVGDTLKTQIYEALRHLAQGFLDYTPNNLQSDPAALKEIYDASLIVLYRMLFVLYAEARDLLPLYESAQYRNRYSFKAIKDDVARDLNMGAPLLADSATVWPRFKTLSGIINAGSPPLHVATFNGGLFDPDKHPFLEKYSVGDGHLQRAIDMLARVGGQFVDYRDLAVRHLGTIYEGLLEYHLEPMPTPAGGWSIDLLNDKGERKATGSYYTPDYIVKYIVEQTLGPVLEEAVSGLEDDNARANAVLACNVLDPAMGSGHFLVEATEYVARFLVDIGVHPPGSEGDDTDLAYWKRRVVQSCIYGVDLNPLAVELAKLSLWLATVAKDRPLSFLDHHLRAGNSLVGARISDLRLGTGSIEKTVKLSKKEREARRAAEAGQQASMLDDDAFMVAMSSAVGSMLEIEENPGLTVEQVKEQEVAYYQLHERLTRKYGRLADFVTATHFGLKADVTGEQWRALADYATGQSVAAPAQFVRWLEEADAIAGQRRFFHWELEFPEVFFDRHGQPLGDEAGFDAVVGNPPYDILKRDANNVELNAFIDYARQSDEYQPAISTTLNIYQLMILKALALIEQGATIGMIIPLALLSDRSASGLRRVLIENNKILDVQAFPQKDDENDRVFPDAKLSTVILIASSMGNTQTIVCQIHPGKWIEVGSPRLSISVADIMSFDPDNLTIPLGTAAETTVLQKLYSQSNVVPLGEVLDVFVGEIDMTLDRNCVQAAPAKYELLKGAHLQRYYLRTKPKQGQREWIDFAAYKKKYGNSVKSVIFRAERVTFQGITGTDDSRRLKATIVPPDSFLANSLNFIRRREPTPDLHFILALINSQLIEWRFRLTSTNNNVNNYEVQALPFRRIHFTTPEPRRQAKAEEGRALYESGLNEQSQEDVLAFVEHHLSQKPEEADVVHDLLAYLAQQMIDLNKQRQAAVEDFVLDLEGVSSPTDLQKIGRLWTPPSNNAEPTTDATAQIGPLARKRLELRDDIGRITEDQWKWLLKGRLKKIANLADLVRVYRQRQPAISTLDARLAYTDSLIDQVVYRLYGLTEDEVGIVEGQTTATSRV